LLLTFKPWAFVWLNIALSETSDPVMLIEH